ncbi:GNAT family N-acetyltransferase [Burkholderia cenocepacia]|uniref:GNAT family N-acetyltransferase n=1 Tax=Burkholderia cenocepacia TaxID=95486 RepID=UPI002011E786|nr:GNAT family N-acetyltransferase [Burkholderia cenocepacia]
MSPSVDELLALDVLTLREHTERAGDAFDVDEHRAKLCKSLEINELCYVRRDGKLVAYAMLRPEAGACWFVGAFGTHPLHRTYTVVNELFAKIATLASERRIGELRSHVYKTNRLSIAFHRKLGFVVTREKDLSVILWAGHIMRCKSHGYADEEEKTNRSASGSGPRAAA